MKFKCTCGHTVIDNGKFDHIKGQVLRWQSFHAAYEQPSATIAEFISAVTEGRREEWIGKYYGQPAVGADNSEVVFDIINNAHLRTALDMYQCEGCGRIHIGKSPQSDSPLRSFKPDAEDWRGTLADQA